MDNIGIDTLKQDKKYFAKKLEEAQAECLDIQNLIVHLQGVLTYNQQLIHLLDEKPKEVVKKEKKE